jgi:hypothetical protein
MKDLVKLVFEELEPSLWHYIWYDFMSMRVVLMNF